MAPIKTAEQLYTRDFTLRYLELQKRFFSKQSDSARHFLYATVEQFVEAGSRMLDIGCGDGTDIKHYASLGREAWGIDASETMVLAARDNVPVPDRIILGDFLTVRPQGIGRFNCLTSRFALHYVPDIDLAYRKMTQLLNPRGTIVIITAHPFKDAQFSRKNRRTGQRVVRYPLFNGKISMEYPAHELSEYLSPLFFNYFQLLDIDEEPAEEREHNNIPGYLGIHARLK